MGTWKTLFLGAAAGGAAVSVWMLLMQRRQDGGGELTARSTRGSARGDGPGKPERNGRRAPPPEPPTGSSTDGDVNALLSVLSHAAGLDGAAITNDLRCGAHVAALDSLALHVAVVAAADGLVLTGAHVDNVVRTLTDLITGGCAAGTIPVAVGAGKTPSAAEVTLGGIRGAKLLQLTASVDVAKVLVEDSRPLAAVSPLVRFVARVLSNIVVDGAAGACPIDVATQDVIAASVIRCFDAMVVTAGRAASSPTAASPVSRSAETPASILRGIDDVCTLLLSPLGLLESHLRPYVVACDNDGAATELGAVLALAAVAPPSALDNSRSSAASSSPVDPASDRKSELQRSMLSWAERLRTGILRALLVHDWVRAALSANVNASASGTFALKHLHLAASAVGSPDAAASGDEPLRRLLDLLKVAKDPLAVMLPDGSVGALPSSNSVFAAAASKKGGAAPPKGDNVLHALLRPLAIRGASLANSARSGSASRQQLARSAVAFDVVAQHVQLAVGFVLGRCNDTAVTDAVVLGDDGRAGSGDNIDSGGTSSAVFVPDHNPAEGPSAAAVTQRWLEVGEGPDARRRVAVGLIDKDGLSAYLMADKTARLLRATEGLPPAMATRMDGICGALSVSDYDVV